MSLKRELEIWKRALEAYDSRDYTTALSAFEPIAETSRVWFSMGIIKATIGRHEEAISDFKEACSLDRYLAISYFQMGVSLFLINRFGEARKAFDDAHYRESRMKYLRGNTCIEYKQLGLDFVLYACECLFNRGLATIYSGRTHEGLADLAEAQKDKQTEEHQVIDEAIQHRAHGYTVFSIPVGIVYRPPASKMRNLGAKDYLGKAKIIAVSDARDNYNGFSGTAHRERDRPHQKSKSEETSPRPVRKSSLGSNTRPLLLQTSPSQTRTTSSRKYSAPDSFSPTPMCRSASSPEMLLRSQRKNVPLIPQREDNAGPFLTYANTSPSSSISMSEPPFRPIDTKTVTLSSGKSVALLDITKANKLVHPPTPPDSQIGANEDETEDLDLYSSYAGGGGAERMESAIFGGPASPLASRFPAIDDARTADWARHTTTSPPLSRNGSVFSVRRMGMNLEVPSTSSPADTGSGGSVVDTPEGSLVGSPGIGFVEVTKIRVNLAYKGTVRALNVVPTTSFDAFCTSVQRKLAIPALTMDFKDEDGVTIALQDDSDWAAAMDVGQDVNNGRGLGKLEVFLR